MKLLLLDFLATLVIFLMILGQVVGDVAHLAISSYREGRSGRGIRPLRHRRRSPVKELSQAELGNPLHTFSSHFDELERTRCDNAVV